MNSMSSYKKSSYNVWKSDSLLIISSELYRVSMTNHSMVVLKGKKLMYIKQEGAKMLDVKCDEASVCATMYSSYC